MNDAPSLVSATATVRSKRSDYLSIVATDLATILRERAKRFYPDPKLVSEAVQKLKLAGFTVTYVGRYGLGLLASKELYERIFKVDLIEVEKKAKNGEGKRLYYAIAGDGKQKGVIDTASSELNDLLDGVILGMPVTMLGADPPQKEKEWYVTPLEIPEKLGLPPALIGTRPKTSDVKIVVIDSGFDSDHPFFKIKEFEKAQYTVTEAENLMAVIGHYGKIVPGQNLIADRKKEELVKIQYYADYSGHGTMVISNLLPIAPDANLIVLKESFDNYNGMAPAFNEAMGYDPSVINCSFTLDVDTEDGYERCRNVIKEFAFAVMDAIQEKRVTVVFSCGNYDEDLPKAISSYTWIPGAIQVGGAYYAENNQLAASDNTHGFPKGHKFFDTSPVPDVCGLDGPRSEIKGSTYVPLSRSEDWATSGGSSLAAGQVSGVCALIKAICPIATPENIREILIRTATQITDMESKTAHGYKLSEIKLRVGGDELSPGLVNINKARITAELYNLLKADNDNATVKEAVNFAQARGLF